MEKITDLELVFSHEPAVLQKANCIIRRKIFHFFGIFGAWKTDCYMCPINFQYPTCKRSTYKYILSLDFVSLN